MALSTYLRPHLFPLLVSLSLLRCSAGLTDDAGGATGGKASSTNASAVTAGTGGGYQMPDPMPWGAKLTGTVWGPGHVFPVSGALVAAYTTPPPPMTQGAQCQQCVKVDGGETSALSGPDGTFTIQLSPAQDYYLVTQKGPFRRVTKYRTPDTVGVHAVEEERTTLPSRIKNDEPGVGDSIPKIALVYGDYDAIEDILGKVQIGAVDAAYGFAWGSEAGIFDVYDNHGDSTTKPHGASLDSLIRNPDKMKEYDVIFFGCSNNARFKFMQEAAVQANIRQYVNLGGKLYVSDYAHSVMEMTWPEFVWFTSPHQGGCIENGYPVSCNHGPPFDSQSISKDPDMSAWLLAVDDEVTGAAPEAHFVTKENWTTIGDIFPSFVGNDMSGNPMHMPPKVWVEGNWDYKPEDELDVDETKNHPLSLSFPYGCGRVLFTTYHTVGAAGRHPGLLTQELVLWHLILELQTCSDGQPVPS